MPTAFDAAFFIERIASTAACIGRSGVNCLSGNSSFVFGDVVMAQPVHDGISFIGVTKRVTHG